MSIERTPPIPSDVSPSVRTYMMALHSMLLKAFQSRPDVTEPRNTMLLASPDGTVYSVGVTNLGALTTVKVS